MCKTNLVHFGETPGILCIHSVNLPTAEQVAEVTSHSPSPQPLKRSGALASEKGMGAWTQARVSMRYNLRISPRWNSYQQGK